MGDDSELQPGGSDGYAAGIDENGVSRREVMRRGALLAGAAAWSTPVVRSLSQPAFAAEGTPEGKVSWAGFVLAPAAGGLERKRVKWEEGAGWEDDPGPTSEENGPSADCVQEISGWDDAEPANGGDLGVHIELFDDGDTVEATLPAGSDYVFTGVGDGSGGRAFGGSDCHPPVVAEQRRYRFEL